MDINWSDFSKACSHAFLQTVFTYQNNSKSLWMSVCHLNVTQCEFPLALNPPGLSVLGQLQWCHAGGVVLFIWASWLQHHSLALLASLRTKNTGQSFGTSHLLACNSTIARAVWLSELSRLVLCLSVLCYPFTITQSLGRGTNRTTTEK